MAAVGTAPPSRPRRRGLQYWAGGLEQHAVCLVGIHLRSHVLAALRVTTRLLPGMRQARWGRVINISILAATIAPPTAPDYSASKAAINATTASMAEAAAADGVTVNAVSPGPIHSTTLDVRFREAGIGLGVDSDAPWEEVERTVLPLFAQVPIGRVGRLDEIADVVAFLASPLAAYITGSNLRVDGGLSPCLQSGRRSR